MSKFEDFRSQVWLILLIVHGEWIAFIFYWFYKVGLGEDVAFRSAVPLLCTTLCLLLYLAWLLRKAQGEVCLCYVLKRAVDAALDDQRIQQNPQSAAYLAQLVVRSFLGQHQDLESWENLTLAQIDMLIAACDTPGVLPGERNGERSEVERLLKSQLQIIRAEKVVSQDH